MPLSITKMEWQAGYALAIPFTKPHRITGQTHTIDATTFAPSRQTVISYAVLEHYERQEMRVPIDSSWTLSRISSEPELRNEVWRRLRAVGLRTVPCRLGPR